MHEVIPDMLTSFRPNIVLYDAGVDPHKDDELGRLALTTQGLLKRDTLVCARGITSKSESGEHLLASIMAERKVTGT